MRKHAMSAVPEDVKSAAFSDVLQALPKGWTACRVAGRERNKPSHLCLQICCADGTTKGWDYDLYRQKLTPEVLAGFKRSAAHSKAMT